MSLDKSDKEKGQEGKTESMSDSLKMILGKIPEPVKVTAANLKLQFLAASKSTQYAISGVAAVVLLLIVFSGGESSDSYSGAVTFEARRGDLSITVLEGGALEALQSQEIRSRVKGREGVKILNIVEEGYRVTPEDVEDGLILVELDKSQLIDQRVNQEIAVETAEASYIERRAQFEMQLNENMTEINEFRQNMKFARLDFEKFLGANVVNKILEDLRIDERIAASEEAVAAAFAGISDTEAVPDTDFTSSNRGQRQRPTGGFDPADLDSLPPQMRERIEQMMAENGGELPAEILERMQQGGGRPGGRSGDQGGDRGLESTPFERGDQMREAETLVLQPLVLEELETGQQLLMDSEYMGVRDDLDFSEFADIDSLEDGEAKQELRSLTDDLQVSQEELLLAQDRIEGQRRLEDRGFITPTELEAEELNLSKAENKMREKETGLALYIQYSFPKESEELLSKFENEVMGYQRQLKENIAEKAQEEARFSSAERKYRLEVDKLEDLLEQIDYATIRAERPGLVVYGASDQNSMRFRGSSSQEAVQEGATIRERQSILTIPDMREMAIKVNIHESAVQRVAVGQAVKVSIDAFPDEELTGRVIKVAVVADSANAFMNPDLKVYPTTIQIDGTHDWLRPGMSAEVEILVDSLEAVVYVPVQAVTYFDDKRVVYLPNGNNPRQREVQVGTFSDSFIEIVSGLEEGEEVLLLAPQQNRADGNAS
jgi:multidrug resistance efflux pump